MNTTRRMFLGTTAAASTITLAGCGLSGGGDDSEAKKKAQEAVDGEVTGEISFQSWSLKNETFTPYFEELIKAFEEENPGTTVKWMDQPGEGYQDKLLSQANSDALPDVINVPPNFAYPLAQAEKLLDLAEADPELTDMYVEGGVEAYQMPDMEGSFGYPWYLGTDMNWWNIDELSGFGVDEGSLPTTFDEMYELALKVHDEGGKIPLFSTMPEFVVTFEGGEFTFNTSENVELLEKYVELYGKGAMPAEVLNNDYTGNATLFKQGKVLWTTATSGYANELKTEAPALLEKTAVTPRIGNPPLFVQGISVTSTSKNLPTALAFAKFLTNDENQTEFVKIAQGFLPGTKKAASDPSSFAEESDIELQNKAVEIAAASMETAEDITNVLWTEDMNTNLTQQMARAMKGEISAQEALDNAVQYGNDNLA